MNFLVLRVNFIIHCFDKALFVSLATDLHENFVTLGAQAGIGQTSAIIKRKVLFIER
jgi:hypothetical protein